MLFTVSGVAPVEVSTGTTRPKPMQAIASLRALVRIDGVRIEGGHKRVVSLAGVDRVACDAAHVRRGDGREGQRPAGHTSSARGASLHVSANMAALFRWLLEARAHGKARGVSLAKQELVDRHGPATSGALCASDEPQIVDWVLP